MDTRILTIDGMSCGHCVARVTKTLAALPGVTVDSVTVGSARITYDPDRLTLPQITDAIDRIGFVLKDTGPAS